MNWVSSAKKSDFLKWFLTHHQLKNTEARRLLEYIVKNHHILGNLSFTDAIHPKERTMIISSIHSDEPGFLFYHNSLKTEDVSKAIGSLMNYPSDKVYLILHFFGKQSNYKYTQLIETSRLQSIKQYEQSEKDAKTVDLFVEISLLKSQINKALDDRNEELFKELASRLKELQNA
ncbi:YpiB family protein [uncultured Metabacillus sp.]|uniref:YpiB family protein n=1 Tax=Metabacillus sp. Hm71 TaxID=3450743 RepID=UPI00261B805E|nr:YpiB family protein [uncultured Metabacillus sp.]